VVTRSSPSGFWTSTTSLVLSTENRALIWDQSKFGEISLALEALPDIPTVSEFVPGYEASDWIGVGAPSNTPAEIIEKLNMEINAGVAYPKLKARLADFGKFIADETEKRGNVIRALNIKAE